MPRNILLCHHCGIRTQYQILFTHEFAARYVDASGIAMTEPATYTALACDVCTELSLYVASNIHESNTAFGQLTYPNSLFAEAWLPPTVAQSYNEAQKVKHFSKAAYVLMGRRTLEAIVKDQGCWSKNLATSIDRLVANGALPPPLVEAATIIRKIGNESAHDSKTDFNELHVDMMESFLDALLNYLYWMPRSVGSFKGAIGIGEKEV